MVDVLSATEFAQKLAIEIAYDQGKFFGRPKYWFRVMCDTLTSRWSISEKFVATFLVVLFVVCVDPDLIKSSTDALGTAWFGKDRASVRKALIDVVKAAEENTEDIKYPKTFKLFKVLFPWKEIFTLKPVKD